MIKNLLHFDIKSLKPKGSSLNALKTGWILIAYY